MIPIILSASIETLALGVQVIGITGIRTRFSLVIQRSKKQGQSSLDLADDEAPNEIELNGYLYRAIATNHYDWSDSKVTHWYNQRGEDSESRIKELKLDFDADQFPCSDFKANALYFLIASLAYDLLPLLRQVLLERLSRHRAPTLRSRLYAMTGKVVKTGRQWFVKLQEPNRKLLAAAMLALRRFEPLTRGYVGIQALFSY